VAKSVLAFPATQTFPLLSTKQSHYWPRQRLRKRKLATYTKVVIWHFVLLKYKCTNSNWQSDQVLFSCLKICTVSFLVI